MKTSTIIEYGAVDLTAKSDSEIEVNNSQEFSKISELKKLSSAEIKYSTLEKNHFVLDGKSENMSNNIEVAWWSRQMSNGNGDFATPLIMTINFNEVHSSLGLTLTFSQYAYCNNLKIQYYDSNDILILEKTFTPDNYDYFCEGAVANYQKIIITFYSTNIPYRYLKLYKILYGRGVLFSGENLISANVLEQVDLLSNELSINTLDFTVYSDDDSFNIINPQGVYKTIQAGQPVNVYQQKNNERYNMGTFYINEWESKNNNKMNFKCVDLISTLGSGTFYGGIWGAINPSTGEIIASTVITVENLIGLIMQSAGISSNLYYIQPELEDVEVSGYIPICTSREALQRVLFSIGAYADCSRSDIINIYKVDTETSKQIGRDRILKATEETKQSEVISGVQLETYNYYNQGGRETLFDGVVTKDNPIIYFDEPVKEIDRITGGTLVEYNANYAIVDIGSYVSRSVTLSGFTYKLKKGSVFVENTETVTTPNILKVESLHLINDFNVQEVGNRIINYYNKEFKTKFKLILDTEKVGDRISVEENFDNTLDGYVTSLDIDLTGGYIADAEVVAKVGE